MQPAKVAELMDMLAPYLASAVEPMNALEEQREPDPAAEAAAQSAGNWWHPWQ